MQRPHSAQLPLLSPLTFWHFQIGGWLLFWCGDILFIRLQTLAPGEAFAQTLDAPLGFGLTLLLRQVYRRFDEKSFSIPMLLTRILFWSMLFALVWHVAMTGTRLVLVGEELARQLWTRDFTPLWLSRIMPIGLGWSALYFGLRYRRHLETESARAHEALSLAREARLRLLRDQVNPHFLFNSLNSVRALINEDPAGAVSMLTELSAFLRYSLLTGEATQTTIGDEIRAVRHYLAIEQMRFEHSLEVFIGVDPGTQATPVPSFLLHPLVENAVKYGMETSDPPLRIRITTAAMNGRVHICVSNSGHWLPEDGGAGRIHGTGTGLENVRARLESAYPGRSLVKTRERDGLVSVVLEFPLDSGVG